VRQPPDQRAPPGPVPGRPAARRGRARHPRRAPGGGGVGPAYVCAHRGGPAFGPKGGVVPVPGGRPAFRPLRGRVGLSTPRPEGEPPAGLESVLVHPLPCPARKEAAAREQASLAANESLRTALRRAGPFDLVYERYSLWSFAGMEYARAAGVP